MNLINDKSIKNNLCVSVQRKTQLILEFKNSLLSVVIFSKLYSWCMQSIEILWMYCEVMSVEFPNKIWDNSLKN